jgi:hypothetical protein
MIDLVIAIGFSHEANDLHKTGNENAFLKCLRRILDTFEELGNNQKFAVFGFAAQAGDESGCFPLRMNGGEWPVPGRQGIFESCNAFLRRSDVKGAKCVSFHKVVECASRQLRPEATDRYLLLLVLTVNDLPQPSSHHGSVECPRFVDKCVETSEAPILILFVGIGKGFQRI